MKGRVLLNVVVDYLKLAGEDEGVVDQGNAHIVDGV